MDVAIDNRPVPVGKVYFREFKYGREAFGYPVAPYRLAAPIEEVVRALESYYADDKEDDTTFGLDASPNDLHLRRLNWPPLAGVAVGHPHLFQQYVFENSYDTLAALFGQLELPPDHNYVINSVKSVRVIGGVVVFEGEAIRVA